MGQTHFSDKRRIASIKVLFSSFILMLFITTGFAQPNEPKASSYPFNFDVLTRLSDNLFRNDSIIPVYRSGKFVYVNTYSKKRAFKQEFEEAYPLAGQYGLVRLNGKYGIINRQGEYLVKPLYTGFSLFTSVNYGIMFGDSSFFSFRQGKMVREPEIGCAEPVGPQVWGEKHGDKYALVHEGKMITDPIYDSVLAVAYSYVIVQKLGKIGIVSPAGKTIYPFEYDEYMGMNGFEYSFVYALRKGETWYYFNGFKMLFNSSIRADKLNYGVFIFKKDSLYNYLDSQGKIALPKDYKWIAYNGCMAINKKDELVLLSKDKKEFAYFIPQ